MGRWNEYTPPSYFFEFQFLFNQSLIMKKIYGIIFLCLISWFTNAQEQANIEKSTFKQKEDGFKEAWKSIKQADALYEKGKEFYFDALPLYLSSNGYNPENAALNYKIGVCYLFTSEKTKASPYFQKAFGLNPRVAKDIHLLMARSYHLNCQFDSAEIEYNNFFSSLSPKEALEYKTLIPRYKAECEHGKVLVKKPVRVFIDNLGPEINSVYPDYFPLISADESSLIFTSRRNTTTGAKINPDDNRYYEDIYISNWDTLAKKWTPAESISKNINSSKNEAAVGLSNDGQELYIYNGDANGGDIFVSKIKGDEWSSPKNVGKHINSPFHESSISFSYDNNTAYFVSDRKDLSIGGRDIYVVERNKKGNWGEPRNIGPIINTPDDEEGVFIHPNNKVLYFSSKGHNSMGGYDVFKSVKDSLGRWREPVNLGYPINTPGDDLFFSMSASGKRAYYSSAREGSMGDKDIFMITFLGPEKQQMSTTEDNLMAYNGNTQSDSVLDLVSSEVEIKTTMLSLVKGTVKDFKTLSALEASIEITDNQTGQIITTVNSNSRTGKFLVPLPYGKNYGMAVRLEGYMFHSENFNIQDLSSKTFKEVNLEIKMKPIAKGTKIVLNNIFFESGKTVPVAESYAELGRLIDLLKENPKVKLKFSGHTDNVGSLKLNTEISQARAQSLASYLVAKGIAANRLEAEGCAYLKPIAPNETESGRRLNRRVEAEIIEN